MSSFSSACKTFHMSPSSREQACGSAGLLFSQCGLVTHDQGQMLGTEHGLMDMTETDYTHLQHLIQAHMELQGGPPDGLDTRSPPALACFNHDKDTTGSRAISPFTASQAIDLSTSTDEHCHVMPGERTPLSYGEVPTFVLARLRPGEDSSKEPPLSSSVSSQKPSRSAARVCLEKRFNASADTLRQQDIQSAVLSNFLTMLQQSAEAQEAVKHSQLQKWMKTDRANPFEVSSPYVGGVFNPVTNTCGQAIGHVPQIMEPNKHQGLIFPKSFSFNFLPERIITKARYTSSNNLTEEQHLVNIESDMVRPAATTEHGRAHSSQPMKAAKAVRDSAGEAGSSTRRRTRSAMSLSQRKERHNSKERERRKRIRLCCDELNMLVPFCDLDTDKVTTLQWTTAFLRYINKTYGDTFKEEFQKSFSDEKGLFLKPSPSSVQDSNHPCIDKTTTIPLVVEQ